MKNTLWLVVAIISGCAIGPLATAFAAELCKVAGCVLPVPVFDQWTLWLFSRAVIVAGSYAATALILGWKLPTIRTFLVRGARLIAFVGVGTLSLALSTVPTVNRFYNRYGPVVSHATGWAPGFSEHQFDAVSIGMDAERVIDVVGEPISRVPADGKEAWIYSTIGHYKQQREKAFHQRLIILDAGKVTEVRKRYLTTDHIPF
jgi:hypothetical protein